MFYMGRYKRYNKNKINQLWCCPPIVLGLRSWKQEDQGSKDILCYKVSTRLD